MSVRYPHARRCESCARYVHFPAAHFDTRCQAAWKARTAESANRDAPPTPHGREGLARTRGEAAIR
jgi:hypothetical protein